MIEYTATVASDDAYELGEGPVWDALRQRVLWVDIAAGRICEGRLSADGLRVVDPQTRHLDRTVGALAVARDGRLLVAASKQLMVVDDDAVRRGPQIVPDTDARRLNDGKCDPEGNFVVGTLSLGDLDGREQLVHTDGSRVQVIDDDLELSNGLAWSPDDSTFYSVDTTRGNIWRRSYDARAATWGTRELLFRVTESSPDGMCTDAAGNLWIALWGAGQVRQYTTTGEILAVVNVAAPHTSSVCFIGDQLDTLLITTARDGLDSWQLQRYPLSGHLFVVADVGARGHPVTAWNGNIQNSVEGL